MATWTLAELVTLAQGEYGNRFKNSEEIIWKCISSLQKMAFDQDLNAFLVWSDMTILQQLELRSSGYVSAVTADIGRTVTGATSGATGIIRYVNNTTRRWAVETSGTFTDGEALTISGGTGAGTLIASDAQTTYLGPYSFPTAPPVRRLLGITAVTDAVLFNAYFRGSARASISEDNEDYGMEPECLDERQMWESVREDRIGGTVTFVGTPSTSTPYRWVYYRDAEDITGVDSANEAKFLIPDRARWDFWQAVITMLDTTNYGQKSGRDALTKFLEDFWEGMRDFNIPLGGMYDHGISQGQP